MPYVYLTLGWLFGLILIASGVLILLTPPYISLSGAIITLSGLVVFPPFRKLIKNKAGVTLSNKSTIAAFLLFFFGGSFLGGMESDRQNAIDAQEQKITQKEQDEARQLAFQERFDEDRPVIISELKSFIEQENYQAAVNLSGRFLSVGGSELKELHAEAKEALDDIRNKKRTQVILEQLNGIPESDYDENLSRYRELVALHPDSQKYQSKVHYYENKKEEKELKEKRIKEREDNISSQFSAWDGSHHTLERAIKTTMHNPDSYEHVQTTYRDRGDHLVVQTIFRGTNAFGGVVRNSVTAKVTLDGRIIEVLE